MRKPEHRSIYRKIAKIKEIVIWEIWLVWYLIQVILDTIEVKNCWPVLQPVNTGLSGSSLIISLYPKIHFIFYFVAFCLLMREQTETLVWSPDTNEPTNLWNVLAIFVHFTTFPGFSCLGKWRNGQKLLAYFFFSCYFILYDPILWYVVCIHITNNIVGYRFLMDTWITSFSGDNIWGECRCSVSESSPDDPEQPTSL